MPYARYLPVLRYKMVHRVAYGLELLDEYSEKRSVRYLLRDTSFWLYLQSYREIALAHLTPGFIAHIQ